MPKLNKNQYSLREVYKYYKTTTKDPLSYKQFKLVLDTWGEKVNEYLLKGQDVRLHRGLSILGIRKFIKKTYVDRVESKRQGKRVLASNSHSNYYGAKVYWRRHYTTFNSVGWLFVPTRALSRALSSIMQTPGGHTTYVANAQAVSKDKPEQARRMYNKKVMKI